MARIPASQTDGILVSDVGRTMPHSALEKEYRRLSRHHRRTLVKRSASLSLASSVVRVLEPDTQYDIWPVLVRQRVSILPDLEGQEDFRRWFERALDRVAKAITIRNADNSRIHPGYKWG